MALSMPAAVVISCCVLAATYVGYREYEHRRDIAEAEAMFKGIASSVGSAFSSASATRVDPRVAAEAAAARRLRRLTANQRCVGGVVITVEGSTYTQLGERCAGGYVVP